MEPESAGGLCGSAARSDAAEKNWVGTVPLSFTAIDCCHVAVKPIRRLLLKQTILPWKGFRDSVRLFPTASPAGSVRLENIKYIIPAVKIIILYYLLLTIAVVIKNRVIYLISGTAHIGRKESEVILRTEGKQRPVTPPRRLRVGRPGANPPLSLPPPPHCSLRHAAARGASGSP